MSKRKSQFSKQTFKSKAAKICRIGEFSSVYRNCLATLREYTSQNTRTLLAQKRRQQAPKNKQIEKKKPMVS